MFDAEGARQDIADGLYDPIISKYAAWLRARIPTGFVLLWEDAFCDARLDALMAVDDYDENRGTSFLTHVTNSLHWNSRMRLRRAWQALRNPTTGHVSLDPNLGVWAAVTTRTPEQDCQCRELFAAMSPKSQAVVTKLLGARDFPRMLRSVRSGRNKTLSPECRSEVETLVLKHLELPRETNDVRRRETCCV